MIELERRNLSLAPNKPPSKPNVPEAYNSLWLPNRYKFYKGGRGSAKSWSVADALIWLAHTSQKRILCTREHQVAIKDSVHKLLKDRITSLGLLGHFHITQNSIIGREHGSEFLFKGLHSNPEEIKSTEGVDICWVEEAEKTSKISLKYLLPTIRRPGSQLIFVWNPENDDAPINEMAASPPDNSIVCHTTFRDNPYFTKELEAERQYCLRQDPDDYDWIWEGGFRKIRQGAIMMRKCVFEDFETPENARFYYGADWGFANDPTALIRCFIVETPEGNDLYIDYEAFGYGVELDELPQLFTSIPGAVDWPWKADGSRPETISHIKNKGFNIAAAKKWAGSVEDGITYLKGFRRIVIHTRCKHLQEEARLYSYKIDKQTEDILPIIVDAWNHGWDAVRYALDGLIRNKQKTQPGIRSV